MQLHPFICRSCLSGFRQEWRRQGIRPGSRMLASTPLDRLEEHLMQKSVLRNGARIGATVRKIESDPSRRFHKDVPAEPDIQNRATQDAPVPVESSFDPANYAPEDGKFWRRFTEVWEDDSLDREVAGAIQADYDIQQSLADSRTTSQATRADQNPPSREVSDPTRKTSKSERWLERNRQQAYLIRTTSDSERQVALKKFWKWKKYLHFAWLDFWQKRQRPQKRREIGMLRWLLRHETVEEMRRAWDAQPTEKRQRLANIVRSAIHSNPEKVVPVLRATFSESLLPSYVVRDTIHHLLRRRGSLTLAAPEDVFALVKLVLESTSSSYLRMRQRTLFLLISGLDSQRLASLYDLLVNYKHPFHYNTQLQIASRLAKDPEYKQLSLDILQSMVDTTGLDINSPAGASLCTSILTWNGKDSTKQSRVGTPVEVIESLLGMGLKPNLITYTAIIRDLCLSKKFSTAWSMFHHMIEQQIEPDARIYSVLLMGTKRSGHLEAVSQLSDMFLADKAYDVVIWNDILHGVFIAGCQDANDERNGLNAPRVIPAFPLMMRAYAKLFAMAPLQTLVGINFGHLISLETKQSDAMPWRYQGLFGETVRKLPQLAPDELNAPQPATLSIMLAGYLGGVSKPYDIISFYSHFRTLLKSGNETATQLVSVQGSMVHDTVIKALVHWPGMLRVALDVVSDMLKDASSPAASPGTPPPAAPRHPAPTVYTWNILLHGFLAHGQRRQAKKVLALMREHGVAPNVVTWNTLVAGYARLQDVGKTCATLRRLEAAGFEPDEHTYRAFGYLKNKAAALELMEDMIEEGKRKLKGSLREDGVGERMEHRQMERRPEGKQEGRKEELQSLEREVEAITQSMVDELHEEARETSSIDEVDIERAVASLEADQDIVPDPLERIYSGPPAWVRGRGLAAVDSTTPSAKEGRPEAPRRATRLGPPYTTRGRGLGTVDR